jgi:hypothetical protein
MQTRRTTLGQAGNKQQKVAAGTELEPRGGKTADASFGGHEKEDTKEIASRLHDDEDRSSEDDSSIEDTNSDNPYKRYWTLVATFCLLMFCTLMIETINPQITAYAQIIIVFIFFLRFIGMLLRNSSRKTSHFRWVEMRDGIDYNRWGEFILDPDVSKYDYYALRRRDPTLPKSDPRSPNVFGDTNALLYMEPYWKWLYFSSDYGTYEKRCQIYYGYGNYDAQKRQKLIKQLDPSILTEKEQETLRIRRVKSSTYFNYLDLGEQIAAEAQNKSSQGSLLFLKVRYRVAKVVQSEAFIIAVFILIIGPALSFVLKDYWTEHLSTILSQWSRTTRTTFLTIAVGLLVLAMYLQYKRRGYSQEDGHAAIIIRSVMAVAALSVPLIYGIDFVVEHIAASLSLLFGIVVLLLFIARIAGGKRRRMYD